MKASLIVAGLAGFMAVAIPAADAQHRGGPGQHGGMGHHAMRGSMMLRAADANGDNTITRAEVEQLQGETFAWMDRNGDGVLSYEDRSPVFQRLRAIREAERASGEDEPRRQGRRGRGMGRGQHAMMDANSDGEITREEFMSRGLENFDRLDLNSDGQITPDELDAAVEAGQERREERRRWWRN